MIMENGKSSHSTSVSGLDSQQLAELIKTANAGLLGEIGKLIASRMVVSSGAGGEIVQGYESEESLRELARTMASHSEVDGTNFKSLGKETEVKAGDKDKADRTIDLLKDIP